MESTALLTPPHPPHRVAGTERMKTMATEIDRADRVREINKILHGTDEAPYPEWYPVGPRDGYYERLVAERRRLRDAPAAPSITS